MPRLMLNNLNLLHYCQSDDTVRTADMVRALKLSHNAVVAMQSKLLKLGLLERRPYGNSSTLGYTYHTTDLGLQLLRNYATMLHTYAVLVGGKND